MQCVMHWLTPRLRIWTSFGLCLTKRTRLTCGFRNSHWVMRRSCREQGWDGHGLPSVCIFNKRNKTVRRYLCPTWTPCWRRPNFEIRRWHSGGGTVRGTLLTFIHLMRPSLGSPGNSLSGCCVCFQSGRSSPSNSNCILLIGRENWARTCSQKSMPRMMPRLRIGRHTWTSCTPWWSPMLWQGRLHCLCPLCLPPSQMLLWEPTLPSLWQSRWILWWPTFSVQSELLLHCRLGRGSNGCRLVTQMNGPSGYPSSGSRPCHWEQ